LVECGHMDEDVDFRGLDISTPARFDRAWEVEGFPRYVLVSLDQARKMAPFFPPANFRPLDSNYIQMLFVRLHIER